MKPVLQYMCPVLPGIGEKWWVPGIACHEVLLPVPSPQCSCALPCRELMYLCRVQGLAARAWQAPHPQWGFSVLKLISTLSSGKGKPLSSFTACRIHAMHPGSSPVASMACAYQIVNCLITSKMLASEGRWLLVTQVGDYFHECPSCWCVGIHSVFASLWEVTVFWATHSSVLELK